MKVAGLFLLLAAPLSGQTVQVTLSPHGPTVGDPVEAVIALRLDPDALAAEPRFPVWKETWGEADVLRHSEPRKVSESLYEQHLTLAAFRTGRVPLPPVEIAVPLRSRTVRVSTPEGLSLDVRSVLPQGARDLRPKAARPPVALPVGEAFWWTLAAMLAACLALGFLLYRQHRRAGVPAAAAPAVLTPFDELAVALKRLAGEPAVRLHTGLSLAFRRYLGRSLDFGAQESTTSEVQRRLLASRLPAPLVRQSVDLLRACDLVKFARQEVGAERCRERLDTARQAAGEIEERLRPAAPLEATG